MLVRPLSQILLFLFSLVATGAYADEEKPQIKWFFQEFPPAYIGDGPHANSGYADQTVAYFFAKMPEYRHVRVKSSYSRALAAMKDRSGSCHGGLFRSPEREEHMVFSLPTHHLIPNRVIILKKSLPLFQPLMTEEGAIQLDKLIATKDLTLGYVASRLYSPRIDAALASPEAANPRVQVPFNHFANMLIRGRVDFVFAYPVEAAFQFQSVGAADQVITLPVAGEPRYVSARIACEKSPFGRAVIDRVNAVIEAEGDVPAYFHYYAKWLDSNSLKTYRSIVASLAKTNPALADTLGEDPEQKESSRDKVRITNGEWPPYLSADLPGQGIVSQIVREAFAEVGVAVEYGFFPWQRSYVLAQKGHWDGSVIWLQTKERSEAFLFSDTVIDASMHFFHLRSNPIQWSNGSDTRKVVAGATMHTAHPILEKMQENGKLKIDRAGSYELLFGRLLAERIETVPLDYYVGAHYISTQLLPEDQRRITVEPVGFETRRYGLMLSRAMPRHEAIMERFNRGLEQLRARGRYDEIIAQLKATLGQPSS